MDDLNQAMSVGRQSVLELLRSEKDIDKIFVRKGEKEGNLLKIIAEAKNRKIPLLEVEKKKLDELADGLNHQGVIAFTPSHAYAELEDILEQAQAKGEAPFLLLLDGITDPHNLGAILRSAEASGVHGVVIPKRRSVTLNETVAKTSAGAIEYVPVARVTNMARTIELLKQKGIWCYGADMEGSSMYKTDFSGPLALVIGNEGKGISRLVKETCDAAVSIPMFGKVGSLNASVAAAVLMFEAVRQRHLT